MPHRYFTNELAAGRAALTGSDAHHLADVMRAKPGEDVTVLRRPRHGLRVPWAPWPASSPGGWSSP